MARTLDSLTEEKDRYVAERTALLASNDPNRIGNAQRLHDYIRIVNSLIAEANGETHEFTR